MYLPHGHVIFEQTKINHINFDTLLANEFVSTVKQDESITGFLAFEYQDRTDALIVFKNKFTEALRFLRDNSRERIDIDELIKFAKKNNEGNVAYYTTPTIFIDMLWCSVVKKPTNKNLTPLMIDWNNYTQTLKDRAFNGFIEIAANELLSYFYLVDGEAVEEFWEEPPNVEQRCLISLYEDMERHFVTDIDAIKMTFMDIFKDMLQTTYSIIIQSSEAQTRLQGIFDEEKNKYPILLKDVSLDKMGLITFDKFIANVDEIPLNEISQKVVGCLIDLIKSRIFLIQQHFDENVLKRTLTELKLVQFYHQQTLKKFNISQSLLELWRNFD